MDVRTDTDTDREAPRTEGTACEEDTKVQTDVADNKPEDE